MAQRNHLGELQALVLTAVLRLGGDANGVSIYDEIESRTGRDPSVAAVHVTLRRLEESGLLVSRVGRPSPRGGRPRRYYTLTRAGADKLHAFREMWREMWKDIEIPHPGLEG